MTFTERLPGLINILAETIEFHDLDMELYVRETNGMSVVKFYIGGNFAADGWIGSITEDEWYDEFIRPVTDAIRDKN